MGVYPEQGRRCDRWNVCSSGLRNVFLVYQRYGLSGQCLNESDSYQLSVPSVTASSTSGLLNVLSVPFRQETTGQEKILKVMGMWVTTLEGSHSTGALPAIICLAFEQSICVPRSQRMSRTLSEVWLTEGHLHDRWGKLA